jgi:hypothetical protein
MLRPDHPALTEKRLAEWTESSDPVMQLEATRTLRESDLKRRVELLRKIAFNDSLDEGLRAEAVMGLPIFTADDVRTLIELAENSSAVISHEALRTLRGSAFAEEQRKRLHALRNRDTATAELIDRILEPVLARKLPAPMQTDEWLALLEGPADAAAGERVFAHAKSANCARCHQIEGRGGIVGPELTTAARTLDRRRLVQSILEPSREVAPQFVLWNLETEDGQVRSGVFLGTRPNGEEVYYQEKGGTFAIPPSQISNKIASQLSVMPDGLASQMTLQEFRDLLAYLQK